MREGVKVVAHQFVPTRKAVTERSKITGSGKDEEKLWVRAVQRLWKPARVFLKALNRNYRTL